jgi:hypothetical protein
MREGAQKCAQPFAASPHPCPIRVLSGAMQHKAIQSNAKQYKAIQSNAKQYKPDDLPSVLQEIALRERLSP